VVAIVLPEGHEAFYLGDDPTDDCWQESGLPVVLSSVAYLTDRVAARLRPLAPHDRIDFSKTTGSSDWMHHREHSTAKLGDFFASADSIFIRQCRRTVTESTLPGNNRAGSFTHE
jgi:hypothetical protein